MRFENIGRDAERKASLAIAATDERRSLGPFPYRVSPVQKAGSEYARGFPCATEYRARVNENSAKLLD